MFQKSCIQNYGELSEITLNQKSLQVYVFNKYGKAGAVISTQWHSKKIEQLQP